MSEEKQEYSLDIITDIQLTGKAASKFEMVKQFKNQYLEEGIHYGIPINPRTGQPVWDKPILYKAGAQSMALEAEAWPRFEIISSTEDFEKQVFAYSVKCTLYRQGVVICEGFGACNSTEPMFKNNKNQNTILKQASKRAFSEAVLYLWGASGIFTQDLEDVTSDENPQSKQSQPEPSNPGEQSRRTKTEVLADINGVRQQIGWTGDDVRLYISRSFPKITDQRITRDKENIIMCVSSSEMTLNQLNILLDELTKKAEEAKPGIKPDVTETTKAVSKIAFSIAKDKNISTDVLDAMAHEKTLLDTFGKSVVDKATGEATLITSKTQLKVSQWLELIEQMEKTQ